MTESELDPGRWVLATTCAWLHEAQLLQSVLESEGIASMLPDEYTLGVQPLYAALLGGVRVLVQAGDLERAQQVLASVTPTSEGDDES